MQKCASFLFSLHHCEISMLGFRTALFLFLFSFVWVFLLLLLLVKPAAFCFSRGGSTTKSLRDNARIDMKVIKDAVLMIYLHSDLYFGSFLKK